MWAKSWPWAAFKWWNPTHFLGPVFHRHYSFNPLLTLVVWRSGGPAYFSFYYSQFFCRLLQVIKKKTVSSTEEKASPIFVVMFISMLMKRILLSYFLSSFFLLYFSPTLSLLTLLIFIHWKENKTNKCKNKTWRGSLKIWDQWWRTWREAEKSEKRKKKGKKDVKNKPVWLISVKISREWGRRTERESCFHDIHFSLLLFFTSIGLNMSLSLSLSLSLLLFCLLLLLILLHLILNLSLWSVYEYIAVYQRFLCMKSHSRWFKSMILSINILVTAIVITWLTLVVISLLLEMRPQMAWIQLMMRCERPLKYICIKTKDRRSREKSVLFVGAMRRP